MIQRVKNAGILASMVACGAWGYLGSFLTVLNFGISGLAANILVCGGSILASLAPGLAVWYGERLGFKKACKVAGILALMVVCGVVASIGGRVLILICTNGRGFAMGAPEGYVEYAVGGVLGFLAPGIAVWPWARLGFKKTCKVAGTLALMVVCGVLTFFGGVGLAFILNLNFLSGGCLVISTIGGVLGFLAPGIAVWHWERTWDGLKGLDTVVKVLGTLAVMVVCGFLALGSFFLILIFDFW
jgi:hypothetical protein